MASDDLDRWLAGLRGARPEGDAQREGARLRQLLQARREQEAVPEEAPDEHAWQRLQFRLRREGLLGPRASAWALPGGRRAWAVAAVLVLTVGLTTLLTLNLPGSLRETQDERWRGGEPAQRLVVADPVASAERLERALAARGLIVRRVAQAGGVRVQALLDEPARQALAPVLREQKIEVPASGRLDVLFADR